MKHPKALYLLNFVSMWEYFSYYGMRVLLVLFLVHEMRYADEQAFGLYALYITLVELSGMGGGILADRFLGLRKSIAVGGWMIAIGHIYLALAFVFQPLFFFGLACIVVGTGLFRSNAAMLLGQYYDPSDPQRETGYTLYYTGINIGGFLATLCCGYVGEVYGWHWGFSLAAFGMLAGNIVLFFGEKVLGDKGRLSSPPKIKASCVLLGLAAPLIACALYAHENVSWMIPFFIAGGVFYVFRKLRQYTESLRRPFYNLAKYLILLVLFYCCEEQLGSSLVLFSERCVDRESPLGVIPASSLIFFNPLTILIMGPLLGRLWKKIFLHERTFLGISFLFLGGAFVLLSLGSLSASYLGKVPLIYIVCSFAAMGIGELFIGPIIYSYASKAAPSDFQGGAMGVVTMGYAMANFFSGKMSQLLAFDADSSSVFAYTWIFGWVGVLATLLGGSLIITHVIWKNRQGVAG